MTRTLTAPILSRAAVSALLPAPSRQQTDRGPLYTDVIVAAIMADLNRAQAQTVRLANALRPLPPSEQMHQLWLLLRPPYMTYKADPINEQFPKQPANLWADGHGDCKSYSIFIASTLANLGIPHALRFVRYSQPEWQHVYVVATSGGKVWKIDACIDRFDHELPYTAKLDMKGRVVSIGKPAAVNAAPRLNATQQRLLNNIARQRQQLLDKPWRALRNGNDPQRYMRLLEEARRHVLAGRFADAAVGAAIAGCACADRAAIGFVDPATATVLAKSVGISPEKLLASLKSAWDRILHDPAVCISKYTGEDLRRVACLFYSHQYNVGGRQLGILEMLTLLAGNPITGWLAKDGLLGEVYFNPPPVFSLQMYNRPWNEKVSMIETICREYTTRPEWVGYLNEYWRGLEASGGDKLRAHLYAVRNAPATATFWTGEPLGTGEPPRSFTVTADMKAQSSSLEALAAWRAAQVPDVQNPAPGADGSSSLTSLLTLAGAATLLFR